MFIEILLFAMPIWLVWGLQTDLMRKFTVVAVFSLRLPVLVAAGLRLHFLQRTIGSPEPLLRGVIPFICLNIEMHYGLMAATMPTLKPFVGAFNTGWGTYDTQGVSGYGQNSSARSYAMQSIGNKSNKSNRSGRKGSVPMMGSHNSDRDPAITNGTGPHFSTNITYIKSGRADPARLSACSDDSKQMIIRQDRTTEVHVEDENRRELNSSYGEDSIEFVKIGPYSTQDR